MSVIGSNILAGASGQAVGYQVSRSLRFNSSDSAYLSRTPASAGNRKTWTLSYWIKLSNVSSSAKYALFNAQNGTSTGYTNNLWLYVEANSNKLWLGDGSTDYIVSANIFRDPSAWQHLTLAVDTTAAAASNRVKLYVNGSEVSYATDNRSSITQSSDTAVNSTFSHYIGRSGLNIGYFDGYLADIHFIDGQALTPSSFTEVSATTGQLISKAYTGSFGTNGFWLKFSDNSAATATTLGKDYSGNSNNWTPNNLSVTAGAGNDSLVDTPTSYGTDTGAGGEVRGNYATLNPLDRGNVTLTNGNLDVTEAAVDENIRGTIAFPATGKWYFECSATGTTNYAVGIADRTTPLTADPTSGFNVLYQDNAVKYVNGAQSSYGAGFSTSTIGVAYDADANQITFYKDNVSQGAISVTSGVTYFPFIKIYDAAVVFNFGQRAFAYTAPSGFRPLVDTCLPAPVVAKGSSAFDALLYTGNGASRSITGLSFNPDLVWIKERNAAADHALYDAVRGAQIRLESNNTDAEVATDGGVTAFNSDGFSLGTLAQVNTNADTYVAWAWDAGTTTASNPDGSITSSVRASASSGFSVVTWTGTGGAGTVGHGLGVAPTFLIVKNRSRADDWLVYSSTQGANKFLQLNTTNAVQTATQPWNNTSPTSTVFSVFADTGTWTNKSGDNYVAYCFAPVAGYSAMGSYVGNSSADGVFVYTGFRPRFIMIKNAEATTDWVIVDTARETYNVVDDFLRPNSSAAEGTRANLAIDILSNGFKQRGLDNFMNGSNTHIYFAVAESPFQYARAR